MTKATLYSFFPGFSVRFAALIERPLPKKGPSAFTAVIIEVFVNDLYCSHTDIGSGRYVYEYDLVGGSHLYLNGSELKSQPESIYIINRYSRICRNIA